MLKRNKKTAKLVKTIKSLAKLNNENFDIERVGDIIFINPYLNTNNPISDKRSSINFNQIANKNNLVPISPQKNYKIFQILEDKQSIILKPRERRKTKRNN